MKRILAAVLFAFICTNDLCAHDTFLKFESYFLKPKSAVSVLLMNGTIEESENNVTLDRMQDVRIVGPIELIEKPDSSQWQLTEKLSKLRFTTGKPGTYIAGVSIKPRPIEMTADKFNNYLKHSGVLDVLAEREKKKTAKTKIIEKYSKHVKALFQVGDKQTTSFSQEFRYPIEIIPQQNPFSLKVGDSLPVKVFLNGKPVANQLVYASYVGFHKHDDAGQHVEAVQTRTDEQGVAQIKISKQGLWYVRLIHMVASEEEGVDYESNWATITFEVK